MVHIYCGDGKGKTTASVGLAVRMSGFGGKVLFAQFFKSGDSSEIAALKQLPGITVRHCKTVPGRYIKMTPEQRLQAKTDYTAFLMELLEQAKDFDLLVLDEVISACNRQIVPQEQLVHFLSALAEKPEVVLTGRDPSEELTKYADYITCMQKLRHPFDQGIVAREGIEF